MLIRVFLASVIGIVLAWGAASAGEAKGADAPAQHGPAVQDVKAGQEAEKAVVATYLLEGQNLKQVLQIHAHSKHRIEFTLTMERPCKRTLTGTAISHGGDPEEDEDEEGMAYPAQEFEYVERSGHTVWIRIDAEAFNKARLKETDDKIACRFSEELMKRR